ncbi:MAG: carbohydrate binding family 9 domain-containing protein [Amphiplicatus sp.]
MLRRLCAPVAALFCAPAFAQTPGAAPDGFAGYTPRFEAVRISEEEAPRIDGDLDDPAWAKAAVIDAFYQIEPVEGAAPSQPTRAYVMYDARNLYVAIYAYDNEPDKLTRKLLERDPPIQDDDAVRVIIDSFGTFRDGYFFATNPNGAINDALVENNTTFRDTWNTIWDVKTRIADDGWIAEFVIPFQSISFDASLDEWGFQIVRTIRRNNEEIRWSNIDRSRNRIDLTNPGRLSGVEDVNSGIGLEAQLFVTGAASSDWETDETDTDLNPSGNFFYKITPSLTGSLTFNTDFSDAPLDERQVNTGRFSLFFPETRDFFLQDAAVFEFGGRIFSDQPNGMPFFSRRIGIVDGRPVDIVAGAKLSGKLGPASVGAVATRTGSSGPYEGQYLSAARVSLPVLAESTAGFVFTHGDPTSGETNTVAGADFQYKNSSTWPGTLTTDFAYQRSFDGGENDGMATTHVAYRSQKWNWNARAQTIGEDYRPRLGFVNRAGINRTNGNLWRAWRPENSIVRYAETGVFAGAVSDLDFNIEDRWNGGWVYAQNDLGDDVFAEIEYGFTDVTEPFALAGEVPVAMGGYNFKRHRIEAGMSAARPFSIEIEFEWGEIYDGDTYEVETEISLKPSRYLRIVGEYAYKDFSLPGGDIGIHVAAIASTIAFTPRMSLKTDIQYDNISENFTFFSRFSWEPRPEQEVFLSFGHSSVIDREDFLHSFRSKASSVALRLGHTLRM